MSEHIIIEVIIDLNQIIFKFNSKLNIKSLKIYNIFLKQKQSIFRTFSTFLSIKFRCF